MQLQTHTNCIHEQKLYLSCLHFTLCSKIYFIPSSQKDLFGEQERWRKEVSTLFNGVPINCLPPNAEPEKGNDSSILSCFQYLIKSLRKWNLKNTKQMRTATDFRNTAEVLGGHCLFIHLVMGRAKTSPRFSRPSTATLDSLGEIKPHIVAFPFKLKSPQIFHGKKPWMITNKEEHKLFNRRTQAL